MNANEEAGRPLIYAHRGASASNPENTLAAFEAAIRIGADGIELDVRMTADGVPVISHDAGLHRAWAIDRAIGGLSLAELRVTAPAIPTFAEVLALVDGRCHLDIEIKEAGVEGPVLQLLKDLPRGRWAISSFDWDVLREIRGLDESAELWVLCPAASAGAVEAADGLDATTLAIEQTAVTLEVVERLSGLGRRVMAWTVNDPARAADLASCGVDAICTDDPAMMIDVLRPT
ncbi:MAG: glycerophosphodiester phosphodiesterase [Actinomycetota bacterium]|nr:glycerophosphodiester phosphodiesterase [Actinomycetota bacterium]